MGHSRKNDLIVAAGDLRPGGVAEPTNVGGQVYRNMLSAEILLGCFYGDSDKGRLVDRLPPHFHGKGQYKGVVVLDRRAPRVRPPADMTVQVSPVERGDTCGHGPQLQGNTFNQACSVRWIQRRRPFRIDGTIGKIGLAAFQVKERLHQRGSYRIKITAAGR